MCNWHEQQYVYCSHAAVPAMNISTVKYVNYVNSKSTFPDEVFEYNNYRIEPPEVISMGFQGQHPENHMVSYQYWFFYKCLVQLSIWIKWTSPHGRSLWKHWQDIPPVAASSTTQDLLRGSLLKLVKALVSFVKPNDSLGFLCEAHALHPPKITIPYKASTASALQSTKLIKTTMSSGLLYWRKCA